MPPSPAPSGDHQDQLEHGADEDNQQLLRFAEASPQDQQRDECRGGQIARERDERLEEGFDGLIGAHQNAERHGDERRQDEAADDAHDRDRDIVAEVELGQQLPAVAQHGDGVGEKDFRHEATERRHGPGGKEDDKEADAKQRFRGRRDRFERTQGVGPMVKWDVGGQGGHGVVALQRTSMPWVQNACVSPVMVKI
jgi:hypothetical protein